MTPPARALSERVDHTRRRLDEDVDCWVSTADPATGEPYLVPLSFLWDGSALVLATASAAPTARNLLANPRCRLGLGLVRDVVLVEGTAAPLAEVEQPLGDAFAAKTGFDPRMLRSPYTYFRVTPTRIMAWREENELRGRDVLRDGRWLAS